MQKGMRMHAKRSASHRVSRVVSRCQVKPSTKMQAMVLPAATFSVKHGPRTYVIGSNATVMGNPPKHHQIHHVCCRDDGVMIKVKPATVAALQPGSRPVDREAALRALKKSCNTWLGRGAQAGAAPRAPLPNAPSQRRDVMTGFKCASRIVVGCIGYASQPLPCSMLLRGSTFCQHQRVFTIPRRTNLSWHM